jgi:hypothetical protein
MHFMSSLPITYNPIWAEWAIRHIIHADRQFKEEMCIGSQGITGKIE